jgi:hypothetical protein
VPVEPKVKSAKTCKLFKRGADRNGKTAKTADPPCYYSPVGAGEQRATGCLKKWRRNMTTEKQLRKFVKVRNASPHQGNLQFYFDAEECGIEPTVFETVKTIPAGYLWEFGCGTLVERSARRDRFAFFPKGVAVDPATGDADHERNLKAAAAFCGL